MVEEEVINAVAAESVKETADDSEPFIFDKTGYIKMGGEGTGAELKDKKGRHQIGNGFRGERKRQPEKRAEQEIKRVGTDKIDTEVRSPVPTDRSGFDHLVGVPIETDLLAVIIAVVCKNASVLINNEADSR